MIIKETKNGLISVLVPKDSHFCLLCLYSYANERLVYLNKQLF